MDLMDERRVAEILSRLTGERRRIAEAAIAAGIVIDSEGVPRSDPFAAPNEPASEAEPRAVNARGEAER